jgi:uncharacterized RDD family membrane protein YckC
MKPNKDPIPTLAYRSSPLLDDEIVGRRALPVERFGAGAIDWAITWIVGGSISGGGLLLVHSELLALGLFVTCAATLFAFDAARGVTVGRRVMGLVIAGPDGVRATPVQLVIRAAVQRIWLWPLIAYALCVWINAHQTIEEVAMAANILTVVTWLTLAFWIVNCLICLTQGSTIPDRLSDTRVVRASQR